MRKVYHFFSLSFFLALCANSFPYIITNTKSTLYCILDLLPIIFLLFMYLTHDKKHYNIFYIFGVLTLLTGEIIQKFYPEIHGVDLILNGICTLTYGLIITNDVHRISNKNIILLIIPFFALLIFSYLNFSKAIEKLGSVATNFYIFALAFFTLVSVTLYVSRKTKNNLMLIFSVLAAYATAISVGYYETKPSLFLVSAINIFFILQHFFMYLYVVNKSWSRALFK